ncbi:PLP-dependent aminotransferase family protein [Nodosilinea sp. LEGE 07088]|uniref:aminotransferase-like domain-containing protein n=1 Tax=Nodosilinea sp. LEGE 07088 TaxID=2777968 RepID=UPI0018830E01|nr:PLP-dependent aminotransferase family protein [Nodosilinea sp. LEGE 07088]MBE9138913.1 PLP-dependent aminotransferase family protein [Nodosilinea sp. LEGE 07088]
MPLSPITLAPHQVLYEQVAERLMQLITDGTLQPGDRLPSVRKLRSQLSVSTSTVMEAYRLLEDRGLILVRPQSGYYVKQSPLNLPQEPSTTTPPRQATDIDISLAFEVMDLMRNPELIQLGAALPALEQLPLAQLNRLMGKVLRENSLLAHAYGTLLGDLGLRVEVAKRMLDAGCSVHSDQMVITNGANEAIYFCLQALTQPGDTVAIESPTYFAMLEAMKCLGLKALTLSTHPRDGISLSHLEEALESGEVKVVMLVSNFSNPLGSCMDDTRKKQLVELLNRYNTPLIEDDVYGDICFAGARPKAIKAFDTEDRVLYCASVSKTLSPGLRVGWCVGGRYHPAIAQMKSIINQNTAIAPQLTVAAFLANGGYDRHLRQLRRAYRDQMIRMQQAERDYFPAETCMTRPEGGHVLWLEMPQGFDSMRLYREALDQRIAIAPGIMFSASGQCYRNCFRLNTAVVWSEAVEQAMQTLGKLAKTQLAENFLRADGP